MTRIWKQRLLVGLVAVFAILIVTDVEAGIFRRRRGRRDGYVYNAAPMYGGTYGAARAGVDAGMPAAGTGVTAGAGIYGPGVNVTAPGVGVNAGVRGATVNAPGVNVDAGVNRADANGQLRSGANINTPGANVGAGANLNAPGTNVGAGANLNAPGAGADANLRVRGQSPDDRNAPPAQPAPARP
jgi:hypothetical protein